METTEPRAPIGLRVVRTFAAPREKVFQAWISPEAIKKWFITDEASWTDEPEVDARPGGHYRFRVMHQGKLCDIHGTYREVKPPERLVFTWQWENDPVRGDTGDTLVTVQFLERGGRTEVVLTHEGFSGQTVRDEHEQGWGQCLDSIGQLVS